MSDLEKKLSDLEKNLKVSFKDKKILLEAITHRSFLNEAKKADLSSNERLEFLGDAVLAFFVAAKIFKKFPHYPEGKLTFIKTYLVRTTTLTDLAKALSLGEFLLMSKGEELGLGRENPVLLANSFEAVIGAIYSDQGIALTFDFLEKQFQHLIPSIKNVEALKDSKSLLQEKVQSKGYASPVYRLISSYGPDHQRSFTMGVFLNEKLLAEGTSKSKQEAEEMAAQKALENLDEIL